MLQRHMLCEGPWLAEHLATARGAERRPMVRQVYLHVRPQVAANGKRLLAAWMGTQEGQQAKMRTLVSVKDLLGQADTRAARVWAAKTRHPQSSIFLVHAFQDLRKRL